jgi:dTDP-glucose pyrophosphorylase
MRTTLEDIKLGEGATIREAMTTIQKGSIEIALVVDASGKLLGTVTDGDIRRSLLGGAGLDDLVEPFSGHSFTRVGPGTGRAEVLDLMRARVLRQIPVVDEEGRLVGLHLLRELVGGVERPNWAVIMAGGRGQRLRPITDTLPKPMVQVAGRPILERLVLHLVGYGIRKIYISVYYKGEIIEGHFGDGSDFGCEIGYLREAKPLGTGGALSLLPGIPQDPLLVMNGDLLTEADLGAMFQFHGNGRHSLTVGLREYTHTIPYGIARVEGEVLTAIEEKPTQTWWANSGLYVLEPRVVARIPNGTMYHLTEAVDECLRLGEPVGAFRIAEDWMDIGRRVDLQRARGEDETL